MGRPGATSARIILIVRRSSAECQLELEPELEAQLQLPARGCVAGRRADTRAAASLFWQARRIHKKRARLTRSIQFLVVKQRGQVASALVKASWPRPNCALCRALSMSERGERSRERTTTVIIVIFMMLALESWRPRPERHELKGWTAGWPNGPMNERDSHTNGAQEEPRPRLSAPSSTPS